jgi:hypothetical protein
MCNKDSYELNKDKYKQYYQQNKEIILKREQLYYQKNQVEIRIKQRTYFRQYYLLNKEKIIANCQRRYYGSLAAMNSQPDYISTKQKTNFCNKIINNNIIIRLMD